MLIGVLQVKQNARSCDVGKFSNVIGCEDFRSRFHASTAIYRSIFSITVGRISAFQRHQH